jgi:hypothetical protein
VSIDVDSCDLWIFLALTDVYRPTVVTIEYNSNYAFHESFTNVCTNPEDGKFFTSSQFTRGGSHWGWSASLAAINKAASRRGYAVVWVEQAMPTTWYPAAATVRVCNWIALARRKDAEAERWGCVVCKMDCRISLSKRRRSLHYTASTSESSHVAGWYQRLFEWVESVLDGRYQSRRRGRDMHSLAGAFVF